MPIFGKTVCCLFFSDLASGTDCALAASLKRGEQTVESPAKSHNDASGAHDGNVDLTSCEEGKANRVSLQSLVTQGMAVMEKIEGCTAKGQQAQVCSDVV